VKLSIVMERDLGEMIARAAKREGISRSQLVQQMLWKQFGM